MEVGDSRMGVDLWEQIGDRQFIVLDKVSIQSCKDMVVRDPL